MGICVSIGRSESDSSATAKIVTANDDLREYNVPVLASQVLEASSSSYSYFLCDSDSLRYDDFIPEMESEEILEPDQIYFVFPISKRRYRLTATDMAALAVKASVAIQNAAVKNNRRRKRGRISPVITLNQPNERFDAVNGKLTDKTVPFKYVTGYSRSSSVHDKTTSVKEETGYSRSGSVKKLRGYNSGQANLSVLSFRMRLETIEEGSVV